MRAGDGVGFREPGSGGTTGGDRARLLRRRGANAWAVQGDRGSRGYVRMSGLLSSYFARLERAQAWHWQGQVLESVGQTIESAGPLTSVGECCEITDQRGGRHLAEVIGFRGAHVLSMPVESTEGIRFGDRVAALGVHAQIQVGPGLMGRVLNALGEPIDGQRPPVPACSFILD